MTTLQRLNQQLRAATQLTSQIEQEYRIRKEVEQDFPEELNEAKQHFLNGFAVLNKLETKIEVAVSHSAESGEGLATLLDNLRDVLTVLGPDGKNLAFIQATSKHNLEFLLGFILQFSEIFQDVLGQMTDGDFAAIEDLVDMARRNRV